MNTADKIRKLRRLAVSEAELGNAEAAASATRVADELEAKLGYKVHDDFADQQPRARRPPRPQPRPQQPPKPRPRPRAPADDPFRGFGNWYRGDGADNPFGGFGSNSTEEDVFRSFWEDAFGSRYGRANPNTKGTSDGRTAGNPFNVDDAAYERAEQERAERERKQGEQAHRERAQQTRGRSAQSESRDEYSRYRRRHKHAKDNVKSAEEVAKEEAKRAKREKNRERARRGLKRGNVVRYKSTGGVVVRTWWNEETDEQHCYVALDDGANTPYIVEILRSALTKISNGGNGDADSSWI